jgi:hypothetical protein
VCELLNANVTTSTFSDCIINDLLFIIIQLKGRQLLFRFSNTAF